MSKKAVNRKCHDILQRDLPCVLGWEGLGAIWKGLGAIWKGLGANRKGLGTRGSLGGGHPIHQFSLSFSVTLLKTRGFACSRSKSGCLSQILTGRPRGGN